MVCRQVRGVCGISAGACFHSILAHSCITLTAFATATDTVLGFAAFFPRSTSFPIHPKGSDVSAIQAWVIAATAPCAELHKSLSIPCLILHPEHEKEVLTALMQGALESFLTCSTFCFISEATVPLTQPHLAAHFRAVDPLGPAGEAVAIADASKFLPPLIVRKARIEDHDDVAPLLEDAAVEFGALAKVQFHAWIPRLVNLWLLLGKFSRVDFQKWGGSCH
jgi:hypothetical protein